MSAMVLLCRVLWSARVQSRWVFSLLTGVLYAVCTDAQPRNDTMYQSVQVSVCNGVACTSLLGTTLCVGLAPASSCTDGRHPVPSVARSYTASLCQVRGDACCC